MAEFTCMLSVDKGGGIYAHFHPGKHLIYLGDTLHFVGSAGAVHVDFTVDSPFEETAGPKTYVGVAGVPLTLVTKRNGHSFPFLCFLVTASGRQIGWTDGNGGDFPVKP